jgi:outer membrane protein, heavy metal efflux system
VNRPLRRGLVLALAALVLPGPANGATGETARVDLLLKEPSQLVSWLESHSADVLAAAARVGQARADLAQSRLLPNPSLSTTLNDVTVGESNPPGLRFDDVAIFGVTLSETMEIGKRGPRRHSAELRLAAGRESYRGVLSDALGQARASLAHVAYLRSRQTAVEANLADARQILDLQRTRLDHGDISGNDYDRLLLDTTILESDVAQNRSEYRGALETCAAHLFAPCDDHVAGLAAVEAAAEVPAMVATWEQDIARRPDLQALDLEEQSARQDAVAADRRKIPDPSFSLGYTRDKLVISGDQPRTLSFGISIPVPLFDRGQHEAARARLRADELRQGAVAALARARADVASLAERRNTIENILRELEGRALARSRGVLDSTVAAVNRGQLSMTDLLLARRTHADLTLKVMDLKFSAFSARNELRQALGLDVEAIPKKED